MTVLLVLFFIIIALAADELVRYKRTHARYPSAKIHGVVQEIFNHDGYCPTMADGGEKIKKSKDSK
jgi:hypothetical protein